MCNENYIIQWLQAPEVEKRDVSDLPVWHERYYDSRFLTNELAPESPQTTSAHHTTAISVSEDVDKRAPIAVLIPIFNAAVSLALKIRQAIIKAGPKLFNKGKKVI